VLLAGFGGGGKLAFFTKVVQTTPLLAGMAPMPGQMPGTIPIMLPMGARAGSRKVKVAL
jgi:hypothetical protein